MNQDWQVLVIALDETDAALSSACRIATFGQSQQIHHKCIPPILCMKYALSLFYESVYVFVYDVS